MHLDGRLLEDRAPVRVEADGEPVEHHIDRALLQLARICVVGGESVPISDEEEAFVLLL